MERLQDTSIHHSLSLLPFSLSDWQFPLENQNQGLGNTIHVRELIQVVLIEFLSESILKSLGYFVCQKLTSGSVKPAKGSAGITGTPHFVGGIILIFTPIKF